MFRVYTIYIPVNKHFLSASSLPGMVPAGGNSLPQGTLTAGGEPKEGVNMI